MPIYLLVLNFLQILARLILGVQSFRYARGKKMKDFYWLAGHFFFFALVDLSINIYNGLGWGPVLTPIMKNPYRFFYLAGDICLVMFVVKTFYQNRKSLFPLFLGISIIWGTIGVALYFIPPKPIIIPGNFLTFVWLAVVAFMTYRQVARDRMVEDWVKGRYIMVAVGSILMCFPSVETLINISLTGKMAGGLSPLANTAVITAIILYYLAWMMPEAFRSFLNRNYKGPEQTVDVTQLSEEEILKQFEKTPIK